MAHTDMNTHARGRGDRSVPLRNARARECNTQPSCMFVIIMTIVDFRSAGTISKCEPAAHANGLFGIAARHPHASTHAFHKYIWSLLDTPLNRREQRTRTHKSRRPGFTVRLAMHTECRAPAVCQEWWMTSLMHVWCVQYVPKMFRISPACGLSA